MAGPKPDSSHIETRLMVAAEMLDRAVAEVRKVLAEINADTGRPAHDGPAFDQGGVFPHQPIIVINTAGQPEPVQPPPTTSDEIPGSTDGK